MSESTLGTWDDVARTFTPLLFTEQGMVNGDPRPYTPEENLAADQRQRDAAERERIATNAGTLRWDAEQALPGLLTTVETLGAILDDPEPPTAETLHALATAQRQVLHQVLRLSRLTVGALDSADVGTP